MEAHQNANIALTLPMMAMEKPHNLAVVCPHGRDEMGRVSYTHLNLQQLNDESDYIANGLETVGITRGTRTALLVKPSLIFFALTFALFKVGAIPVIVDSGIGLKNMGKCLEEAQPEAFIGIPQAQAARILFGWGKKTVKINVTAGKKFLWGGHTLAELRRLGHEAGPYDTVHCSSDDTAAILFTSGSTGAPKGALYTHGIFNSQIKYLQSVYDIKPGEMDLSTFPLFALFGPALGMTSIIPDMDPTKPASADPRKLVETVEDFGATNMFASPALINLLGRYAEQESVTLSSIKRVISAGAPARPDSLQRFHNILQEGVNVYTPYGATEALPVCNIGSQEILRHTSKLSEEGKGTCVGKPNPGITLKAIAITDDPIETWSDALELKDGEIGELAVKGPVVTREYFNRPEATKLAKIYDGEEVYHRMGDVGYRDKDGRFWFCGRKSHRVITEKETLFTIPCEAVFNNHPKVFRTALVGVKDGDFQKPVVCVELEEKCKSGTGHEELIKELREIAQRYSHTKEIRDFLIHPSFPVDIRHNAKIFREKLAVWAENNIKS